MKLSQLPFGPTRAMGNRAAGSGLAVIGATATAFTTTVAIPFLLDGAFFSLAAQTNTALAALVDADLPTTSTPYLQPSGLAGFYTQPANTTVFYVIGVNAAGTVKVVQGTFVNQAIPGGQAVGDGNAPDVPDGFIPFALLKVISGGSTFVPGTTALTSIGTFRNIAFLPAADRPF